MHIARWGAFLDRMGTWLNWLGNDTGGMSVRVVGKDDAGRSSLSHVGARCGKTIMGRKSLAWPAVILANKLHRGDRVDERREGLYGNSPVV